MLGITVEDNRLSLLKNPARDLVTGLKADRLHQFSVHAPGGCNTQAGLIGIKQHYRNLTGTRLLDNLIQQVIQDLFFTDGGKKLFSKTVQGKQGA